MDAPAKANSGHSGTAMALAPLGVMLWGRVMRHDPTDPHVERPGPVHPELRSRVHPAVRARPRVRLRPHGRRPEGVPPGPLAHARPPRARRRARPSRSRPVRSARASPTASAWPLAERILRARLRRRPRQPPHVGARGRRLLRRGHQPRVRLAGRLPRPRSSDDLLRRQPHHHRRTDRARPARRPRRAIRRVRLARRSTSANRRTTSTSLEEATREAIAETAGPTLIIVRSHIGFPSPEMMDRKEAHGTPFQRRGDQPRQGDASACPTRPFVFDPAICRRARRRASARNRDGARGVGGAGARPPARGRVASSNSSTPTVPLADHAEPEPFAPGSMAATRKALQRAMDAYAPQTPGLTAGSADLTDNTGVELTGTRASRAPATPGGRQIHYGIREFAMNGILVGQACHGGICARPVRPSSSSATTARPAIRLASLEPRRRPLRLHPRFGGCRRRRPDPPAGRAPHVRCAPCPTSTSFARATRTRRSTS